VVQLRYIGDIRAKFHKIFLVVAEIGLQVPTYPRIRTTKLVNLIVFRRLWTKVHKIFYTYKSTSGTVYHANLTGVAAEHFWRIAKTINFNIERIWVDFGTGKPISATTGYMFMKLGGNIA